MWALANWRVDLRVMLHKNIVTGPSDKNIVMDPSDVRREADMALVWKDGGRDPKSHVG